MSREAERVRKKLEEDPVVECNKIQKKFYPELFKRFADVKDPRNQSYTEYSAKVMLTDRGSEFTDPLSIEFTADGKRRTRIFYCDPQRSNQKGGIEVTHEMIHRVLKKGTSFDNLVQDDVSLMMSHINSYKRKKLGNRSAHQLFSFLHGEEILEKLGITLIPSDEINLTPLLLKK